MKKNWKDINDMSVEGMEHYWIYDTNEGLVEGYLDADHRKMTDKNGKLLLAVTHFKDYYVPDDSNTELRNNCISQDFIDFLINNSNFIHTEFRLVVNDNGHCYSHVLDRNSETYDFDLPNKAQYDRKKKLENIKTQDAYIDWE